MNADRLAVVLLALVAATGAAAPGVAAAVDGAGTAVDGAGTADAAAGTDPVTMTVHLVGPGGVNVSDADVTVSWDGGQATATTRSNGKALVDVPRGATLEVTFDHPDYTRNAPYVIDSARGTEYDIPVFDPATLDVTVVEGGSPVEGANVTLYKVGRDRIAATGETGSDGVFTPDGTIESGPYRVVVGKEGYTSNETEIDVSGDDATTVAIEQQVVAFEVTVVDDHFDPPQRVPGATIQYEGVTSGTIELGGTATTQLALQVNADYTVTVSKDGYETTTRTVAVGEEGGSLQFVLNRADNLTVEPDNREVLVGNRVDVTVTDEYGEPVPNATVRLDGEAVGETDAEGVVRVTIESAGSHTLTARKGGVSSDGVTIQGVSPDGESTPTATEPADEGTPTDAATATATGTSVPIGDFSQPTVVMKIAVAAGGVLLAFLVVRRLL